MGDIHVFRSAAELSGLPAEAESLSGDDIEDADLAGLDRFPGLRVLYLDGCAKLGDEALAHLSPIGGLRELYITGNGITDDGLARLASLRELVELGLDAPIVGDGFRHLVGLPALAELHLPVCPSLEPGHLDHLSEFPALTKLCFYSCPRMTDGWLDRLTGIRGLRVLGIRNCPGVSPERIQRLPADIPGLVVERT